MRAWTGAANHRAGRTAEACVASHFRRRGLRVVAERWRGAGGEVDLIAQDGGDLVFVEVKKSRSFAEAAARISLRQIARIQQAAAEFMGLQPDGQNTQVRFDVALVDSMGRIEVLENAFGP